MTIDVRNHPTLLVIIPVYSARLSLNEHISFRQILRVFKEREIAIIHPASLELTDYKDISKNYQNIAYLPCADYYFENISSYNKWLLTPSFYQKFISYDFICICQLDVFVFKDDFGKWLSEKWDYVGAPWFEGFGNPTSTAMIGAGNGGFSLRKTKSILTILNSEKPLFTPSTAFQKIWNARFRPWVFREIWKHHSTHFSKLHPKINEDYWLALQAPKYFKWYNVAPPQVAKEFSVEVNPRILVDIKNLPMGCHAWWKYDPDFIFPLVRQFGYEPQYEA